MKILKIKINGISGVILTSLSAFLPFFIPERKIYYRSETPE
jgi:hypothetical protein